MSLRFINFIYLRTSLQNFKLTSFGVFFVDISQQLPVKRPKATALWNALPVFQCFRYLLPLLGFSVMVCACVCVYMSVCSWVVGFLVVQGFHRFLKIIIIIIREEEIEEVFFFNVVGWEKWHYKREKEREREKWMRESERRRERKWGAFFNVGREFI